MKFKILFLILSLIVLLLIITGIGIGSADITFSDAINALFTPNEKQSVNYIVHEIRLPRTLTSMLAGMALSIAGLMLQTVFSNPLAGPYILGISSGASLLVAITTIGLSSGISMEIGVPAAALMGSFLSVLLILFASKLVKNPYVLLIIGVMFASFSSAAVSVLEYFSNPADLKSFIIWSMGDFSQVTNENIGLFSSLILTGIIGSLFCVKLLNAFLLGENLSATLGINPQTARLFILIISAVLAGSVTAYCGPVAFIGLAVPNLIRFIVKSSNHVIMLPMVILAGGILGMLSDQISRMPSYEFSLPINIITALIGAPVVIMVLLKNRKSGFS